MRNPKEAKQERAAERTPTKPSQGLVRTQSPIMTEPILKSNMTVMVTPKYGMTELVLFSNSVSRVRDTKRETLMLAKDISSIIRSSASSHRAALHKEGRKEE